MSQKFIDISKNPDELTEALKQYSNKVVLLVCGNSFYKQEIAQSINDNLPKITKFSDFSPNPTIEQVQAGLEVFKKVSADIIIGAGGGSAMDVAKCIKYFSKQEEIPLIALPTTAGTGSESTSFAVMYENNEKQSLDASCLLPDLVILDSRVLENLPEYQKKCTLLDAWCQAIESYWSVSSTEESKKVALSAITEIEESVYAYLTSSTKANYDILHAANLAGQAINYTRTTAPHAMSYKITSLYGAPHGHAVALCLPIVWDYMRKNVETKNTDPRGPEYLTNVFSELSTHIEKFKELFNKINMPTITIKKSDLPVLAASVNPQRLANNPVKLDEETLYSLYSLLVTSKK
ncbi:MAG: phosphonoacetaldehyde reductase [Micrococcaceae bacterium]